MMRPLLSLLAALLLTACGEKPPEKKGAPPALITTTQARAITLEVSERTLGTLEAVMDPKVAAEVAGRVVAIGARSGQAVKKGQMLARIDPADVHQQASADSAEVARLEALLTQQERVVARQAELVSKNFISRNALDDATAQRDALKNQLAAARSKGAISRNAVDKTQVAAPFDDPTEVFRMHFFAGIAHACHGFDAGQLKQLDPGLQAVVEKARQVSLEDYMTAVDRRSALGRATRAFHEKYDLLLTPTLAVAAFTAGRLAPEGWAEDWLPWAPFCFPFNLTGQPAATVPCGFTEAGLPVGLQVVGPMYGDAQVLRAARAYQAARPTFDRRPPI